MALTSGSAAVPARLAPLAASSRLGTRRSGTLCSLQRRPAAGRTLVTSLAAPGAAAFSRFARRSTAAGSPLAPLTAPGRVGAAAGLSGFARRAIVWCPSVAPLAAPAGIRTATGFSTVARRSTAAGPSVAPIPASARFGARAGRPLGPFARRSTAAGSSVAPLAAAGALLATIVAWRPIHSTTLRPRLRVAPLDPIGARGPLATLRALAAGCCRRLIARLCASVIARDRAGTASIAARRTSLSGFAAPTAPTATAATALRPAGPTLGRPPGGIRADLALISR